MDIKSFLEHKILTDSDFVKKSMEDYSTQTVWHAIGDKHIVGILDDMALKPFTKQRYWDDGIRLKDDHPEYENSKWMYGWSMTRKKEYAMDWNAFVIELDLDKIKKQFEVQPFAWNFLFTHNTDNRKEHEEFVISHYGKESIPDMKQADIDRDELIDALSNKAYASKDVDEKAKIQAQIDELYEVPSWYKRWDTTYGKSLDLNNCLKGIYISERYLKIFGDDNAAVKRVMEHPLYKGIFVPPKDKEKLKDEKRKMNTFKP